ncbi:Hsp20/alpha crystallin family protein [Mesobacillus maritimus]
MSIEADLPGFQKEDIQVDLDDYSITIKAIRSTESEEKREKYYRRERQYGSVERVIPLPAEVITNSSSAKYEDGVLKITLEKANPTISQRKSISIE